MVVEQKLKVLRKAENEIYQNMNSNLRKTEKNSVKFRKFAENSRACNTLTQASIRVIIIQIVLVTLAEVLEIFVDESQGTAAVRATSPLIFRIAFLADDQISKRVVILNRGEMEK